MFIVNDLRGGFHEQFEILCELKQMIEYDVMT
jgi:hypothetical protein